MTFKEQEKRLRQRIETLEATNNEYLADITKYRREASEYRHEAEELRDFKNKYYDLLHEYKELKNKSDRLEKALELERSGRGAGRKPYSNKQAVELIFNAYYLVNKSLQTIADMLNSQGIKTSRGSNWNKSSVKYVLNNKKYVDMEYVEEKVFNDVQKMLNDNRKY